MYHMSQMFKQGGQLNESVLPLINTWCRWENAPLAVRKSARPSALTLESLQPATGPYPFGYPERSFRAPEPLATPFEINAFNDGTQKSVFFAGVFERACETLAYIAATKRGWQADVVGKFLTSQVEQPGLVDSIKISNTDAQQVMIKVLRQASKPNGNTGAAMRGAVSMQSFGNLAKKISLTKGRREVDYYLETVEIDLAQVDYERFPEFTQEQRKVLVSGKNPPRGYYGTIVYPNVSKRWMNSSVYFFQEEVTIVGADGREAGTKKLPKITVPNEVMSVVSYYFNGVGEWVHTDVLSARVQPNPRLRRATIAEAAEICNRAQDFFTVSEWERILMHMSVELCPSFEFSSGNPGLVADGSSMRRTPPPSAGGIESAVYRMDVVVKWSRRLDVAEVPGVTDYLSLSRVTATLLPPEVSPEAHWAQKAVTIRRATWRVKWTAYVTNTFQDDSYTFELQVRQNVLDPNTVDVFVESEGESFRCIWMVFAPDEIHLELLFYEIKDTNNCRLLDPAGSPRWSEAVLKLLSDAGGSLGVKCSLDDASYWPDGKGPVGQVKHDGNFYEKIVSPMTATMCISRGYGFYEARGFFAREAESQTDREFVMECEIERLEYQQTVATAAIEQLVQKINAHTTTRVRAGRVPRDSRGRNKAEVLVEQPIRAAGELLEWFKSSKITWKRKGVEPPFSEKNSLREIQVLMASNGVDEFTVAEGKRFFNDTGLEIRKLFTREVRKQKGGKPVPYPGAPVVQNYFSSGPGQPMQHYVLEKDPEGGQLPLLNLKSVEPVDGVRWTT